jgi:hypothetical protein
MVREEELKNRVANKLFILLIKYILHILGFLYLVYTILGFLGIDAIVIGYFAHVTVLPWMILYAISIRFKFCYVHRIPLYYIALNDIITVSDHYINLSSDIFTPLVL